VPSISYEDSVLEALCFGWVGSHQILEGTLVPRKQRIPFMISVSIKIAGSAGIAFIVASAVSAEMGRRFPAWA